MPPALNAHEEVWRILMQSMEVDKTNMHKSIGGVSVPDSKLAREIKDFVLDTDTELLFNHSSRVYYFAAIAGKRRGLQFDAELLYAGAMFHDVGLMPSHSSAADRFEVDGE